MSEGGNLWYLNNGTADGQLATKSEIEDRVASGSDNQYQVIISGDYAANQCVKYSDIKITKVALPSVNFNCILTASRDQTYAMLSISDCNPSNMKWSITINNGQCVPDEGTGNEDKIQVTPDMSTTLQYKVVSATIIGSASGYESLSKRSNAVRLKVNI